ncbi:hypothetical protein HIMB11_00411 [Rhodobacteraceae bacterium HIMB11]|nr:hypothetical protein HIMB11_00411 [Rhodobacteraceae bacterium HIMB11]
MAGKSYMKIKPLFFTILILLALSYSAMQAYNLFHFTSYKSEIEYVKKEKVHEFSLRLTNAQIFEKLQEIEKAYVNNRELIGLILPKLNKELRPRSVVNREQILSAVNAAGDGWPLVGRSYFLIFVADIEKKVSLSVIGTGSKYLKRLKNLKVFGDEVISQKWMYDRLEVEFGRVGFHIIDLVPDIPFKPSEFITGNNDTRLLLPKLELVNE